MKKNTALLITALTAAFVWGAALSAQAYVPVIVNVVLDASGSVSDADFAKANQAAARFADLLYRRSQAHPDQPCDWISVNWFGGANEYGGTRFINCSRLLEMAALSAHLRGKEHPKYNATGIYNAIVGGTNEIIDRDNSLPYNYLRVLIVVTDGQNNSSTQEAVRSVRSFYPSNNFTLMVVGVGGGAQVSEFKSVADHVENVDDFDALGAALVASLEILGLATD